MRVENEFYAVDIDDVGGLVTRITDKRLDVALVGVPRLADGFRIVLPIPTCETNCLLSAGHGLFSAERARNGAWVRWNGEFSNANGPFDVNVSLWLELVDEAVQFRLEVENRTAYEVSAVWFPLCGCFSGLDAAAQRLTRVAVPCGSSWHSCDVFAGVSGEGAPERIFRYPGDMSMPWASVYNPAIDCSLYIGSQDRDGGTQGFFVTAFGERRAAGRGDESGGVSIGWACFDCAQPGDTFYGPPITLQCRKGDGRASAAVCRQ